MCEGAGVCKSMIKNHHITSVGGKPKNLKHVPLWEKNSIPEPLIDSII